MKHQHAENMALYAQDAAETDKPWERWESLDDIAGLPPLWRPLPGHPAWLVYRVYRRKQQPKPQPKPTMTINTTAISQTKQWRRQLVGFLQSVKVDSNPSATHDWARSSREREIAITKIQEAIMWLGMDLKAINDETPSDETADPYPESYKPESPTI